MRSRRFNVTFLDENGIEQNHVLYNLAKKARLGELEPYIDSMLDHKAESKVTHLLIWLDAFEASMSSGNTETFERFIRPLTQEEKREQWRLQKRREKDAMKFIDATEVSNVG